MRHEPEWDREMIAYRNRYTYKEITTNTTAEPEPPTDPQRDALIDIAHDCGTLEAAQKRAREALKK